MAGTVVVINQGTELGIANDLVGGTYFQAIKLDMGTAGVSNPFSGTIPQITNLAGGTITRIEGGTVVVGTVNNLASGTINSATAVLNSGTINVATAVITSLPNLPQGSINVTAGTIASVGTIGTLGLVNTVTTVSNVTNGSIVVTAGTIAAHAITAATITEGTIRNLISGTINAATAIVNSGTINVGTFVMPSGTITTGSIIMTAGTVLSLIPGTSATSLGKAEDNGAVSGDTGVAFLGVRNDGNATLAGSDFDYTLIAADPEGRITIVGNRAHDAADFGMPIKIGGSATNTEPSAVTNGDRVSAYFDLNGYQYVKVGSGTIRNEGRPARNILTYGTTFVGTAAAYGTLVGSAAVGVGTSIWVNNVSIVNAGGTATSLVGFGTVLNGTSILAKGNFGPQGGIEKEFPLPANAGMTNQDLVCYIAAAGTIDVNISYFIAV